MRIITINVKNKKNDCIETLRVIKIRIVRSQAVVLSSHFHAKRGPDLTNSSNAYGKQQPKISFGHVLTSSRRLSPIFRPQIRGIN